MTDTAQNPLEIFAALIQDLADTAERIARAEEAKAEAASLKQHHRLDGLIQEEQAQILKLRGLEQRRLKLAEALGWKSLTFRQILSQASPDEAEFLRPYFLDLEQQLQRLEQARKSSEQIIHTRLHEMEVFLARQQGESYDSMGNLNSGSSAHLKLQNKYV